MPYKCVADQRAAERRWKAKNPQRQKEIARKYREKNREKLKAVTRAWNFANKERARANRKVWEKNNPEKLRAQRRRSLLKSKYDLTPDEVAIVLEIQGGVCAICKTPLGTGCVDHSHRTGRIRGILCSPCNTGIGHMRDDPMRLRRAADYLEREDR